MYLGVDGGGSRCRARIEDEYGCGARRGRLRACNNAAGHRQGVALGHARLRGCGRASRIEARGFSSCMQGSGLPASGAPGAEATLQEIVHPFQSDSFHQRRLGCLPRRTRWRGRRRSLSPAPAPSELALIGGREIRIGGYGFPISDEGSGADIGLQAIRLSATVHPTGAARHRRCSRRCSAPSTMIRIRLWPGPNRPLPPIMRASRRLCCGTLS